MTAPVQLPTPEEIYGAFEGGAERLCRVRGEVAKALRERVRSKVEVRVGIDDVSSLERVAQELETLGFAVRDIPLGSPGKAIEITDGRGGAR